MTLSRKASLYEYYDPLSSPDPIKGKWKLEFIEGGPALPPAREIRRLVHGLIWEATNIKAFQEQQDIV